MVMPPFSISPSGSSASPNKLPLLTSLYRCCHLFSLSHIVLPMCGWCYPLEHWKHTSGLLLGQQSPAYLEATNCNSP